MTQVPAAPRRRLSDRIRGLAGREAGYEGARANLDHLLANQAAAAVAISGADKSDWNGVAREISGGSLGTAWPDGSLDFDKVQVVDPLVELSRNNGRQQDPSKLLRFRNALQTMLHEHSHVLTPADRQFRDSGAAAQDPTKLALEEGVTEAWSATHVNEYIDVLGAEEMAPGIKGVVTREPYPQYVPAVQALADGIGHDTRLGGDEVLRRLNTADPETKWAAAADMMFRSTDLPSIAPADHHDIVRGRIQYAMQSKFAHLSGLQGNPDQLRLASVAAGQSALSAGRAEVQAMHQHYRPVLQQNPELSRQQGQQGQQGQQQTRQQGRLQVHNDTTPALGTRSNWPPDARLAGPDITQPLDPHRTQPLDPDRTQPLDPDRTQPLGRPRDQPIDLKSTQQLGQRHARPGGERTATGNRQPIDPRAAWAAGLAPSPGPQHGQRTGQQAGSGVVPPDGHRDPGQGGPSTGPAAGHQADPRAGLPADLRQAAAAAHSGTAPPTTGSSGETAIQTATSSGTPPRAATVHRLPHRAGGSEHDR
ncbi:MAG: hypothetical protein QOH50_3124 [Kribbellaceae bacterium]|jgi:hypothetical protein|nr:hypothetical protein [Kribbellaceae bacterium]